MKYKIYFASMTFDQGRSLLESKGYNVISYDRAADWISVLGEKKPSEIFHDILPSSNPDLFIW